ncbi:hypothetical protein Q5X42_17090 [Acinetobacter baumannii]|nr:hypothetical protein [Acinetobacter baumannii]
MRFTNIGFEGFKTGISVPEDCDLVVENANFENVGTCYEVRSSSKKISKQKSISVTDEKFKFDVNKVIQNLHNLEMQAKRNKDFEKLKKIRKLKGLIGSKKFLYEYLVLLNKG